VNVSAVAVTVGAVEVTVTVTSGLLDVEVMKFVVGAAVGTSTVPVQKEPMGQQAILPALSREQMALVLQQARGAPTLEQAL